MSFKEIIESKLDEAIASKLEEKKMDAVGKEDDDIDNDGDVDSSDEYLHKRRKAIKKAMNKEEVELEEGLYTVYGVTASGETKVIGRGRGDSSSEAISDFLGNPNHGRFKDVYKSFSAKAD